MQTLSISGVHRSEQETSLGMLQSPVTRRAISGYGPDCLFLCTRKVFLLLPVSISLETVSRKGQKCNEVSGIFQAFHCVHSPSNVLLGQLNLTYSRLGFSPRFLFTERSQPSTDSQKAAATTQKKNLILDEQGSPRCKKLGQREVERGWKRSGYWL